MSRKPPPETYAPTTRDGWEARAALLKQERDRYRQALELVLEHGCALCRDTARKALGLPL